MGIEELYLNIINAIYDNCTANFILKSKKKKKKKKIERIPTIIKNNERPLLFNIVLEVLSTAIREGKAMKGIQIEKEVKKKKKERKEFPSWCSGNKSD